MSDRDLKDPYRETRVFTSRAWLFFAVMLVATLILAARAFYLQIVHYDRYRTLSDHNRVLLQPVPPTRGLIYDAAGVLLADNRPHHSLNITVERVTKDELDNTIAAIRQIIPLSDAQEARFHERLKQYRRPYEPVALRRELTDEEMARLAVNIHKLPGVSIEAELQRYYPLENSTAHVLGYVGRINEKELAAIDPANYSGTHYIGKIGIEKFYEGLLHGEAGYRKVEINARGRVLRALGRSAPKPGEDITLYLDSALQRAAEEALGDRRGAVVAIDPTTGGILALVSRPSFNPNLFVTGIDSRSYGALRDSKDLPLFNRALRGQYPPGSTVKPFVALGGLEQGLIDWEQRIYDPGWYQIKKNGRHYRDWKKYGHGRVDLNFAIMQSCDTFFYEMAHRMSIDQMHDFLGQFGFGQRTTLDTAEAVRGVLPSSAWKKKVIGEPWYTGDSLNASIGQGFMLATPLQLATATAVLANRGRWVQPRLLKAINGEAVSAPDIASDTGLPDVIGLSDADNWARIIGAMKDVVHHERGTAKGISKGISYDIAGKTGTAQVIGIKQDEEYDVDKVAKRNQDHALFVAFAPVEQPKIAVAVIVENGGGGGSTAAPVARQVLDAYLGGG